jgi:hypothetical protein
MAGATTLDQVLSGLAREGELFERPPGGRVRRQACGPRRAIPPGLPGIGKVSWTEDGRPSADRA